VGGIAVTLPDATRSGRVYPLLQNLDLENLAFATVQGVGNTLNIEEMNEDELRRLVLVNLARLTVAGEWNGLLTAGGGTQYAFEPIDASLMPATYSRFSPTDVYRLWSTTVVYTDLELKASFFRFVAPKDGTMGQITVRTGSTQAGKDDARIGIYSSSAGLPSTRIGDIDIDVNGSADLYSSSSWNTAPTLTAGDTYWIGFVSAGATYAALSTANYTQYLALGITHYPGTAYSMIYNNAGTDSEMPSTIDLADTIAKSAAAYVWTFQYA